MQESKASLRLKRKQNIYRARSGLVNLDSARHSSIEALRSDRRSPSLGGKGEDEDRLGKVAASPNSPNLIERGIDSILVLTQC